MVFLFEVITKSVYSAPSEQKRKRKIPHLHHFQPEMYSRQSRQGGRTAPLDKWFGSVFEGLWIPRPSVILTFKYTHRIPNIVPPFMTLMLGDRIYVSPMDTLGLLLNFMAISILIQSRFTGTIFFSPLFHHPLCSSVLPSFILFLFWKTNCHSVVQAAFELMTLLHWLCQAECMVTSL